MDIKYDPYNNNKNNMANGKKKQTLMIFAACGAKHSTAQYFLVNFFSTSFFTIFMYFMWCLFSVSCPFLFCFAFYSVQFGSHYDFILSFNFISVFILFKMYQTVPHSQRSGYSKDLLTHIERKCILYKFSVPLVLV